MPRPPGGCNISGVQTEALQPAGRVMCNSLRTLRSVMPYPFLKVIWKTSRLEMKAASRVRLCLPLPPTPTSSALPRGDSRIRFMRQLHEKV